MNESYDAPFPHPKKIEILGYETSGWGDLRVNRQFF